MCWMIPGGRVCRVRVLLTAMVILHGIVGSLRITLPISASKGRWPPSCSATCTPFTHWKEETVILKLLGHIGGYKGMTEIEIVYIVNTSMIVLGFVWGGCT